METFDLAIVGAGPAGLYAAYYAGFRGLRVCLIDSLEALGGQITALYPDKFIYDVAGFPKVFGKELVAGLVTQMQAFKPVVALGERVERLLPQPDGSYRLETSTGSRQARAVLITIGVGAFTPKRVPAAGAQAMEGKGLAYFVPDASVYDGKRVVIVGGGDSAVDWALNLLPRARQVVLVHRRDGFRAHEDSVRQLKASSVALKLFCEVKEIRGNGRVESVVITHTPTRADETLPADEVLACLGFETSVGPLSQWGLTLQGRDVVVNTRMETNLKGVYAAGDVTAYPGKVKLISVGFGEAATAVNNAAAYLRPGASVFPGHSSNQTAH